MMLTLRGPFGSSISLDWREQFGRSVELNCFQFLIPPPDFRLVRNGKPLQDWQTANTDLYDLQHGHGVTQWTRDGHLFINDVDNRRDVMTCGLLSQNLTMETRGLALDFILLLWLREGTLKLSSG